MIVYNDYNAITQQEIKNILKGFDFMTKKIIVKAIAKATKANAKTTHVPFYKSVSAPAVSAPDYVKDDYIYILRYVTNRFPQVGNYPEVWKEACKRLYDKMYSMENIYCLYKFDYWYNYLFYCYYNELLNAPSIHDSVRKFLLVSNLWYNAAKRLDMSRPFYGRI